MPRCLDTSGQGEIPKALRCGDHEASLLKGGLEVGFAAGTDSEEGVFNDHAENVPHVRIGECSRRCGYLNGGFHVKYYFELKQVRALGHRLARLPSMGRARIPIAPCGERFLVGPLGDHEIAIFACNRAQELEAEESGCAIDRIGARGKSALEFGAGSGGDIDRIDLYDTHRFSILRREDASLLRNTKEPS